jgi:hypothetical protein
MVVWVVMLYSSEKADILEEHIASIWRTMQETSRSRWQAYSSEMSDFLQTAWYYNPKRTIIFIATTVRTSKPTHTHLKSEMYGCIFLETICKKFKRNIKLMSNCELMK